MLYSTTSYTGRISLLTKTTRAHTHTHLGVAGHNILLSFEPYLSWVLYNILLLSSLIV